MEPIAAAVHGLAAGDALSWLAEEHREFLLPSRRIGMLRFLDTYADATQSTTRPRPHVHSSPVSVLRPGPADDLEWFTFSALALAQLAAGDREAVSRAWIDLAVGSGFETLRGRTGTMEALRNLRRGLRPPQSGNDNAHYFDDIACVRAVAAGLLAGDHADAVRLATADAEVTHARDGVWCARSMAVLVCGLAHGTPIDVAIDEAVGELPVGTWSHRTVLAALGHTPDASSALDLAMRLTTDVVDKVYSYAVSAPETLALLYAHARYASSADELMLGAFAHGRNADALPALAGAVAGLRFGDSWVPTQVTEAPVVLDGVCIPALAGRELDEVLSILKMTASVSDRSTTRPHGKAR